MIYGQYLSEKFKNANSVKSIEGYPLNISDAKKGTLKELVISGNCESDNVIPYPYTEFESPASSVTSNGITVRADTDGSLILNGTCNDNTEFKITKFKLPKGYYRFLSIGDGQSAETYRAYITNSTLGESIYIENGIVIDRECEFCLYIHTHKNTSVENIRLYPKIQEFSGNMFIAKTFSKTLDGITYTGDAKLPYIRINGTKNGTNVHDMTDSLSISLTAGKKYIIFADISGTSSYTDENSGELPKFILVDSSGGETASVTIDTSKNSLSCCIDITEDTVLDKIQMSVPSGMNFEDYDVSFYLFERNDEFIPYSAVGTASKNLIKYPYSFGSSVSHRGITFTTDSDGAIVLNGTNSGGISQCNFDTRNFLNVLDKTKTYYMSQRTSQSGKGCQINMVFTKNGTFVKNISANVGTTGRTINLSELDFEYDSCHMQILAFDTFDNFKIYPQIEEGTKASEWCPSGKSYIKLRNDGKNALPYPYYSSSRTSSGLTYTTNDDRSVSVSGAATTYSAYSLIDYRQKYRVNKDLYIVFRYDVYGDVKNYAREVKLRRDNESVATNFQTMSNAPIKSTNFLYASEKNLILSYTLRPELYDSATPVETSGTEKVQMMRSANVLSTKFDDISRFENGFTAIDNGNGTVTINGKPTTDVYFDFISKYSSKIKIRRGQYMLSGCPYNKSINTMYLQLYIDGELKATNTGNGIIFSVSKDSYITKLFLCVKKGYNVSKTTLRPKVLLIPYDMNYVNYRESITSKIIIDKPVGYGDSIALKDYDIPMAKGANNITLDSDVKPQSLKAKYIKS